MYNKVGYTIVGLFVIIFGAGMIWFAFWLTKGTGDEKFNLYKIHLIDSVTGLSKDAMVKLHGVNIGRVVRVAINPQNIEEVEIDVLVEGNIPIKEDMVAHTQMVGITGMLAIEIEGGTNEAKTLHAGDILNSKPSVLSTLSTYAEPMLKDISLLIKKTHRLFSDKNIKNIEKTLVNIEHFTSRTDAIEKRLFTSLDEVDHSLKEAREFMTMLTPQIKKATSDFTVIKDDVHLAIKESVPLIKQLKKTTKDLKRVMLKVERSLDRGDYNMKKIFEPMLIDSQMLMKQLSDISKTLEQSPSDLIFKSKHYRKAPGE